VIYAKFRNAGQTCICPNRVLVQRSILDEFTARFSEEVSKLKVGNGFDDTVDIGPIINEKGFIKIKGHIEDALQKGASVSVGLEYIVDNEKGCYFVKPTVLTNVTRDMEIMQEETFGPVAPVIVFDTIEEAVEIANDTPNGLAAYFFTNDYKKGTYLSENLDYGKVGWNDGAPSGAHTPFGSMKESGLGREGGSEGIEPYLETKYLSVRL